MKIVYLAHPIAGDMQNNLNDLRFIIRQINRHMPEIVPFCPYYADVAACGDEPAERDRGISNCTVLVTLLGLHYQRRPRTYPASLEVEMWLTGARITAGMEREIATARIYGIPIYNKIGHSWAFMNLHSPETDKPMSFPDNTDTESFTTGPDYE